MTVRERGTIRRGLPGRRRPRRYDGPIAAPEGFEAAPTTGRGSVGPVGGVGAKRLLGAAGLGVLVSGLVVNVYLAVVARALPPAEYATFGSFWALALVLGFGAFLPLEQQLAQRLPLTTRRGPLLGAATRAALGLALFSLVVLLAAAPVVTPSLDGSLSAYGALVALCLVSAAQFLLRGTLIGTDRLVRHGGIMVLDALLRLGLAAAVFATARLGGAGVPGGAATFCWALVAAIALAHLPQLPAAWRRATALDPPPSTDAGPDPVRARPLLTASVPLLVGSACAQLLLNGLPVLVVAASTDADEAAAGVFVAAFTLAKAPLSMVVPLQSAVVPTLTRLIATGQRRRVVALLAKGAATLVALAAVGVPLAWWVGPPLISLVFGADYAIGGADLALITCGVLAHIALVVLTQVHVARGRHRDVGLSWAVALAVAAAAFWLVPGTILAAESSFLLGSLAGAVTGCLVLASARRSVSAAPAPEVP